MRYCEYCCTPLDDDALFCTKCGARLSDIDPSLVAMTPQETEETKDAQSIGNAKESSPATENLTTAAESLPILAKG